MARRCQHASRYLRGSGKTGELIAAIEDNLRLLKSVRVELPAPLDAHCLHAGLEDGVLTLVTDSPVWGSRLRFFAPELTRALESSHGTIESSRIRVQPTRKPQPDRGRPANRMSEKTVELLLNAADGMGETDLARALRRLAKAGAARV